MFPNIVSNPAILGGKPCIRGTRLSVDFVLELIASGASAAEIAAAYPQLTTQDVRDAVLYVKEALENDILVTAEVAR